MNNPRILYANQRGVTLIEMLVVVGMIAILGAISYPVFSQFAVKYNFRAAAREVMMTAMQARSNSIRDNAVWQLTRDSASQYTLVDPATGSPGTQTHTLDARFALISAGSGKTCGGATGLTQASSISFNGRGFASPIGTFYVSADGKNECFRIVTSANGVIRTSYFNGSSWTD